VGTIILIILVLLLLDHPGLVSHRRTFEGPRAAPQHCAPNRLASALAPSPCCPVYAARRMLRTTVRALVVLGFTTATTGSVSACASVAGLRISAVGSVLVLIVSVVTTCLLRAGFFMGQPPPLQYFPSSRDRV
jgi:hypothetical protein